MGRTGHGGGLRTLGGLLGVALVSVLALPLLVLALSASPDSLRAGLTDRLFLPAFTLSLRTTCITLVLVVTTGTPLSWWLSRANSRLARTTELLVDLPIVIPPAVVGVALLRTFGHSGALGPWLETWGIRLPFTEAAVVLAQTVVSAPFFVQAAANAFRKVDPDLLIVARTLGAGPVATFARVAIPVALPGLVAGASLSWARALGEFGATLLFAGNLTGTTQTMPLAIFQALESDVRVALVFSLILAALGALLLVAIRLVPRAWASFGGPLEAKPALPEEEGGT